MKVCQALVEIGHEIQLWLPGGELETPWDTLAEIYGIRARFPIQWIRSARALRRYDFCARAVAVGKRWQADLFYVWPLQAAALISRMGGPSVLEIHDRPRGRFGPWLFTQFLRGSGARRLLPNTDALRSWLSETYRVVLEPPFTLVSPNGVDLIRYHDVVEPTEARRSLDLREGFTVGYTGHLYPGRGVDLLLELARRNPNINFVWAGGENATIERWRQRIDEISIDNIFILGFVPNDRLPLIQAACEVLVMPYERRIFVSGGGESMSASPMKVFEYLATGRAILSSDLPVLREVLNDDNAVLLPPEDVDAWDLALRELIDQPNRRKMLSTQARQDAAGYSWVERARKSIEGL